MSDEIRRGEPADSRPRLREAQTSGGIVQATAIQIGLLVLLVLVNLLMLWVLWSAINAT